MIRLLPVSPELESAVHDADALLAVTGASAGDCAELLQDIIAHSAAHRTNTNGTYAWGGFIAVTTARPSVVIGTCAFVTAPNADGEVEIAYFTFPPFEGQGYGNAMASALVDHAIASGAVRVVFAHTLPESNASTSILARQGFEQTGISHDADAGEVWRWERAIA